MEKNLTRIKLIKLALSNALKLPAIERNVTEINREVSEIRTLLEDQELRTAAWQVLFTNQQLMLESTITELNKTVREISAYLPNIGSRMDKAVVNDESSFFQLENELKRLSDILNRNLASIKQGNNDQQL